MGVATGLLSLAAALFVELAALTDFLPLSRQQAALLAIQLVFSAVFTLLSIRKRRNNAGGREFAEFLAMTAGFVDMALAVTAVEVSFYRLWPLALMAIPGVAAIAASGLAGNKQSDVEIPEEVEETPPELEIPSPLSVFWTYGILGAYYAVALLIPLALLCAGIFWFYILKGSIVDGNSYSFSELTDWLVHAIVRVYPMLLAGAGLVTGMMFALGVGTAAWQFIRRSREPNATREFTQAELHFIDQTLRESIDWARSLSVSVSKFWIGLGCAAFLIVGIALGASVWSFEWLAMRGEVTPNSGSVIYLPVDDVGPGIVAAVFAGLMLAWLLAIFVLRWPPLIRLSAATELGGRTAATLEKIEKLRRVIARAVRRKELAPGKRVAPSDILAIQIREPEPYLFIGCAVLVAATAWLTWNDLANRTLITAQSIEYVEYWSHQRHAYAFSDVKSVQIQCWIADDGKDVVSYQLNLVDGTGINLAKHRGEWLKRAHQITLIDGKLRAATVSFDLARWKRNGPALDRDCLKDLEGAGAPKSVVRSDFHADD